MAANPWKKVKVKVLVAQSCPTLCNPMDCSLPGSSVHGLLQARILVWVAMPFSRWSSLPRGIIWTSCIADRFFTTWAMREAQCHSSPLQDRVVHPSSSSSSTSGLCPWDGPSHSYIWDDRLCQQPVVTLGLLFEPLRGGHRLSSTGYYMVASMWKISWQITKYTNYRKPHAPVFLLTYINDTLGLGRRNTWHHSLLTTVYQNRSVHRWKKPCSKLNGQGLNLQDSPHRF